MNLDDAGGLAAADPFDTRGVLADFPRQCREARTLRPTPAGPRERPRVIVVAGMGGSAAGGDLLAACAADALDVPVLVHRGYGLPAAAAGPHALVLASSYSGDTEEVLSAVEAAVSREVAVVALTAGGRLGALAERHRLARVTLPAGLMPRMALGYLFLPALGVLAACGAPVADDADIDEALDVLEALAVELAPSRPAASNEAKRLALAIGDRLPAVYGGPVTGPVAYRWKTDLEENAKTFALAGALPEMNHNEIEAWRPPEAARLHALLLREEGEPAEIARRFSLLRDIIGPAAGGMSETRARGRTRLARLLSLAYLGQWTSYYLALRRGIDPWTVPRLDELKRRLRSTTSS
ncbi:MAG TPA: bifunctional phosphoglucose/phosphomannose isomerase [Candidatus Limnocylindria bacterium]|nr:bifunctional phosphoglucose/phosphomannose isomerase [Candidatus Limnocylindria bacterium]